MQSICTKGQFLSEIRELRQKYPMVCIKVLSPDDFHNAMNGPDADGNRGEADWDDPVHSSTAGAVGEMLEESKGRDWMAIRRVLTLG